MRLVRRALELVLIVYVVGVVGLAAAARLAPLLGHGLYSVRSASMSPTLAIGDLVVTDRLAPEDVRPGDVVTVAVGSTVTLTHRVVMVTDTDDGPVFLTKGDANGTPDPVATRAEELRGRVAGHVPILGFLLAMLTMPSGVVALVSIGGSLLTAAWLMDEDESGDEQRELDELRGLLRGPRPAPS